MLFGVLQTVALLRHGDELDWSSPSAVGYVVGLAAVTVVGAWLLARGAAAAPMPRGQSHDRDGPARDRLTATRRAATIGVCTMRRSPARDR